MIDKGKLCTECGWFKSCTNPAKETRGRSYIGCANKVPVAVGAVSDILIETFEEINEKLAETGYMLADMWVQEDNNENLIVRFAPEPPRERQEEEL